jgi:hypothetical protein
MIRVNQYYNNSIKPSLKKADEHKANSREIWLTDYISPKIYEEI